MTTMLAADEAWDDSLEDRLAKVRRRIAKVQGDGGRTDKLERLEAKEQKLRQMLAEQASATALSQALAPLKEDDSSPPHNKDAAGADSPPAPGLEMGTDVGDAAAPVIASLVHAGGGAQADRERAWRPVDHTIFAPAAGPFAPARLTRPTSAPVAARASITGPAEAAAEPELHITDQSPEPADQVADDSHGAMAGAAEAAAPAFATAPPIAPRVHDREPPPAAFVPASASDSGNGSGRRAIWAVGGGVAVLAVAALVLAYPRLNPVPAGANTVAPMAKSTPSGAPSSAVPARTAEPPTGSAALSAAASDMVAANAGEDRAASPSGQPSSNLEAVSRAAAPPRPAVVAAADKTPAAAPTVKVALASPPPPVARRPEAVSLTASPPAGPLLTELNASLPAPAASRAAATTSLSDKLLHCLFSVGGSSNDPQWADFCGNRPSS